MNFQEILAAISFALTITLPNLILMGLGFFMQRKNHIGTEFVDQGSKMVFNYCLPCLLFLSVADSQVDYGKQITLIIAGLIVTLLLFIGAEVYSRYAFEDVKDQSVFVQGVFRSNMAIIGLATVTNAYGGEGLGIGAVYMGIITIVYNILAIMTLSRIHKNPEDTLIKNSWLMTKKIFTNPLIIALASAFLYKALALPPITGVIHKTGSLLAAVSLPLALICAGATIDMRSMLQLSGISMQASIARIIIAPLLSIFIGILFGLRGVYLGVLFIMVASPVAAASYVMAKAMGGNDVAAANILAFTTIFSMVGMAIGAAILRGLGLM